MNARILFFLPVICAGLGLSAGCASDDKSHVVAEPPPAAPGETPARHVVVLTQPAPAATLPANGYLVPQAPPSPEPDDISTAADQPSARHIWIAGYWSWQHEHYKWITGHWEVPPGNSTVWTNPHWESEGGSYRFHEGHWN